MNNIWVHAGACQKWKSLLWWWNKRLLWILFIYFFNFIDYSITVVLGFPPLPSPAQLPPLLQVILPPLFMSMSHVYKFVATPFPILYFTSPWLFCNYLFVLLNLLTSSSIPPHPFSIWQLLKHSPYPWFCLCSSCLLSLIFRFNCW